MKIDSLNIQEYFEKYKDNVFAIGFNYFRNSIEADDIVQETFLKLFRSNFEFESEEHIRNWIIKVAVNECKRVTLSSWFKKKESLEEYTESLQFEDKKDSELFTAVMELPTKYRRVVHLYYYEGYSTKEIAELVGITETAVSTRLLRARKKLKEKLSEVCQDE